MELPDVAGSAENYKYLLDLLIAVLGWFINSYVRRIEKAVERLETRLSAGISGLWKAVNELEKGVAVITDRQNRDD